MRFIVAALWILIWSSAGQAQSANITRIDIVDVGLYKAKTVGSRAALGTSAGAVDDVTNETLVQATTKIEARIGNIFGFHYKVSGAPASATGQLNVVALLPPPGMRNPATQNTMRRNEFTQTAKVGSVNFVSFQFEESWELLPGTWTFEVWSGKRKLASQSFEVVKP